MHIAQTGQSLGKSFNIKARKRHEGLRRQDGVAVALADGVFRLLVHCASHGEFEQVKPLIEIIKEKHPNVVIIGSFFSPSGYEMASTYSFLDEYVYLPIDTKGNMRRFVDQLKPDIVLLVRYEIWVNFIDILHRRNIPIFLISGLFFQGQVYFKKYAGILRKSFKQLNKIFVQDEETKRQLDFIGVSSIVAGDSRADRVVARMNNHQDELSRLNNWKRERPLLVLGSIWPEDWAVFEKVSDELISHYNLIVAPHEIDPGFVKRIRKSTNGSHILWTEVSDVIAPDKKILILDSVGVLADVYRYADVAYVGGGFGQGLHNIFEPAVYGLPILIGPEMSGFPEAEMLVRMESIQQIHDSEDVASSLQLLLQHPEERQIRGQKAREYVLSSAGSSERMYSIIKRHLD